VLHPCGDQVGSCAVPRPELYRLLEQVRPGDTLVVWRLDRLGRSLRHLIDVATDLGERRVGFRSLAENIDTTTPGGHADLPRIRGIRRVRTRAHPAAVEGRDGGGTDPRADGWAGRG
jgi:DNA invertase Pin-like site-specific DNA recombinase